MYHRTALDPSPWLTVPCTIILLMPAPLPLVTVDVIQSSHTTPTPPSVLFHGGNEERHGATVTPLRAVSLSRTIALWDEVTRQVARSMNSPATTHVLCRVMSVLMVGLSGSLFSIVTRSV